MCGYFEIKIYHLNSNNVLKFKSILIFKEYPTSLYGIFLIKSIKKSLFKHIQIMNGLSRNNVVVSC